MNFVASILKYVCSLFLMISIALLSSCDNDPNADGQALVTIDVDASNYMFTPDVWFVAWDENGKFLDVEKFAAGKIQVLRSRELTTAKISFGIFEYMETPVTNNVMIFTDVEPGITFTRGSRDVLEASKGFTVNFSGVTIPFDATVSSQRGAVTYNLGMPTLFATIDPNADKYLVSYRDKVAGLRYKMLNDVHDKDVIALNVSDLSPYENQATFNLPSLYDKGAIRFYGFEGTQSPTDMGYVLDESGFSSGNESITTGYYPAITKFVTVLQVYNELGMLPASQTGYYKSGSLPGTINWPDHTKYTINSLSFDNLSVSVDSPVEYIAIYALNNDNGVTNQAIIYSPDLNPVIGEVPEEILSKRPSLALTEQNFRGTSVAFYPTGAETYDQMLSWYFTGETSGREYTYVNVIKPQ